MELRWHRYKYFPYERVLGLREVQALLAPRAVNYDGDSLKLKGVKQLREVQNLVYFAEAGSDGKTCQTLQGRLERVNGNGPNRQSTRYSVHGLHEYKGKFNPQTARAILNILGTKARHRVIDPFCGSGTTLVECAHLGIKATGTDLNPMAIFVANAKLQALGTAVHELNASLRSIVDRFKRSKVAKRQRSDARSDYLSRWFSPNIAAQIDLLRESILERAPFNSPVFLCIASNLLRSYSLQDPNDLRIRRRTSPLPDVTFSDAFLKASREFIERLAHAQAVLKQGQTNSRAVAVDARTLTLPAVGATVPFDCAITSPPYATALPYIDTQRLSLVWLGLIAPNEIHSLEAQLVGSRELRGLDRQSLRTFLLQNVESLPVRQAHYCVSLLKALGPGDGFRRRAVPFLLYRYFADMRRAFRSIRTCMRRGAPFALIIGGNHTILGGRRFDIRTAKHLTDLARSVGWTYQETLPLQTYQRYGYHANNAVSTESLLILRAG